MSMRITACMIALLAGAAGAETSEVSITLSPAGEQDPGYVPYRTAELAVDNPTEATIQSISLRDSRGGARVLILLTAPPKSARTVRIALPAASIHQDYIAAVVASEGTDMGKIADVACTIEWSAEVVDPQVLIDPALYRPWEEELPAWPARVVRTTFLLAVLACLALAATWIARRPAVRAAAVLAVLASASAGVWVFLDAQETVVVSEDEKAGILAVRCRRAADRVRLDGALAPVYASAAHMEADESVLFPGATPSTNVWIRPDQVLLLRRLGQARPLIAPE